MKYDGNANLLKQFNSLLTFLLCVGLLIPTFATAGFAQSEQNGLASLTGMTDTPGFIDDDFRPVLSGTAATVNRTLVQPDGKILVAGNFHLMSGKIKTGIARFNADGSLDVNFNTKSGTNGQISAIGLQTDGKIIIGGVFSSYGGQTVGNIARLNADGSFDVTFNSTGIYYSAGANNQINDISVLPDNKILIGGSFTNYNGTAINRLARLNQNGNIDMTFDPGTGANSPVSVIKQYSGGKILVGGFFTNYSGTAIKSLARINTDGSIDTSFNIGTGPSGGISAIAVQPDDKILVGGTITTFNTVPKNGIARLNADGSDDSTFTVSGTGASINAIARQSDGKLIVGGTFPAIGGITRQSIARLNADGSFDAAFDAGTGLNPTGNPAAGSVKDLALQTDGSVILVGNFTSYNGTNRSSIARANTNGTLDTMLNPTALLAGNINAIAKQADGKVLIGGTFTSVGDAARSNIARINEDGTLDMTFNPGTGANSFVNTIGVQADGKIVIGGNFTNYNGTNINRIARINADGSLDTSFNPGTGVADGEIATVATQTDGKILVGGVFPTFNNITVNNIARLNADGSLDSSFATGTGVNTWVRKFIVQPDGKILVGGDFSTFSGSPKTRLMRLNADGGNDASFNTGTINSSVRDFVRDNDGKIVIVGSFTSVNGITRNRAARLNPDGSLDETFDPGAGFNQNVLAITALPNGKYMVGGAFTTVGGLPRNRIARLRSNGTLDPKFLQGLGPNGSSNVQIRTIVPHNDRYLIGGQFETYNTSARSGILLMSNATKAPVDYNGDGKTDWAIARHYGGIGPWTYWIKYNGGNEKYYTFDFGVFSVDNLQPGDFDGDGKTDVAIWRGRPGGNESAGYWIIFSSTNQVKFVPFGLSGDRTTLEDYDGDGKDDMSVWRVPETTVGQATWFYQASFNNPNNNITYFPFGMRYGTQSDQVDDLYPGDVDGDGKADFRIQRRADTTVPSSNTPAVFYTYTTSNGKVSYDYFGWASDRTIPGDYDGDGKTDLAIARGFNFTPGTTIWYIRYTDGRPDAAIQWGAGGLDQFAQGDYDGDGTTDLAVYRRANENNYYIRRSSDLSMMVAQWGNGDGLGGPASDVAVATYNNR